MEELAVLAIQGYTRVVTHGIPGEPYCKVIDELKLEGTILHVERTMLEPLDYIALTVNL